MQIKHKQPRRAILAALLMLALAALACNFPGFAGKEEPTPDPDTLSTQIAQTLTVAAETAGLPTGTMGPTETQTPSPTFTLPVSGTTPAVTQPPGGPTILANDDTNCRTGPTTEYQIVGVLLRGQQSSVHGRLADNSWWYIAAPGQSGVFCWIWGGSTTVTGDLNQIPVLNPPPPPPTSQATQTVTPTEGPTPTPTSTKVTSVLVSYANTHVCGPSKFATFQIVNNSDSFLRSLRIQIVDLTANITLWGPDDSNTPFLAGANDCPPGAGNIPPGGTGYVGGPLGLAPIPGNSGQANIRLCAANNLGGVCVDYAVPFTIP